jgi:O-antigen ligase
MTTSTFPDAKSVATSAQSLRAAVPLLDLLVCLAFVTSSLRWFTVLSYGSVSVEPIHLALLFLLLYFFFSQRALGKASRLLSYAPLFWTLYTLYLLLSLAFLLRKGFNPAIVALLPQLLYIPAFFVIYSCLFQALLGGGSFKYYLGTGLAIIVFFLALGISAAIGGADLASAWSGLVGGGSFYGFNRVFTKVIFNTSGFQDSLSSAQFVEYSTSIKNELASCVVVLYAIMRSLRDFRSTWWSRCLESSCFGIAGIIVVLSFSRSAFLCLALALCLSFAVSLFAGRSPVDRTFLAGIGFLIAAAAVAAFSNVGPVLLASFEDSVSYDERLQQFHVAVQLIEANIWTGIGTNIEVGGHDIHNLFLATWVKSGFFAFLAVLLAYLLLLGAWARTVVKTVAGRSFWRLAADPGWVFAIPIVPLLRVYLSGKGGTFSISMWLGAAAFLAFIVANRAAIGRAMGAQGNRPPSTDEHG